MFRIDKINCVKQRFDSPYILSTIYTHNDILREFSKPSHIDVLWYTLSEYWKKKIFFQLLLGMAVLQWLAACLAM